MEFLLRKKKEWKNTKRLIIKCSFFEIYLNEVRDLGRKFISTYKIDSDEEELDNNHSNMNVG